jgi:Zn-dependent metalloprotease
MSRRPSSRFVLACLSIGLVAQGTSAASSVTKPTAAAAARLREKAGTGARVSMNPATGVARFVSVPAGRATDLAPLAAGTPAQKALAFFNEYAGAFGIRDASAELSLKRTTTDKGGMVHLDYAQVYAGVPVFAGILKAHFASGALRTVNGVFVPEINVNPIPRQSAAEAGRIALAVVAKQKQAIAPLAVTASKLYVYRTGLAQGVAGENHLAYEVEVGNKKDVREFVYVDAHSGAVIDQVTGIQDALTRRVYDGGYGPGFVVWNEGDAFPTPDTDINNIITFTSDTYNMYLNTFGRDTHTGLGTLMETVNNDPTINCPNANWNGVSTNYCTGVTGDDTVAHEWTHAYTQYTHGLIYAWQPGALNESYSDIFGEIVDTVNGPNLPDNPRTAGSCSQQGGAAPPTVTVASGSAAGTYTGRASANEPPAPLTVGPNPLALAVPAGACTAVSGVSGSIAIIDWTLLPGGANECGSIARATNALNAGATGIIFVAPPAGLLSLSSIVGIASIEVPNADGAIIKAGLPANATITLNLGTDNSFRWLSGEDDTAFGGAIRDLWNPNCFGHPGRANDIAFYTCATADGGGVHSNSGVPNHGFALMVEGGTYNGQTVVGLGMTKAAHIYYRAMTVYQHPATDFADHADALEQSCQDLIDQPVTDLFGGDPLVITAADCLNVAKTTLAVAFRTPPTFCNFQPLLAAGDPPLCAAGQGIAQTFYLDNFESSPLWTAASSGTVDFTPRDWTWVSTLPDGRAGKGFFAPNPDVGTCNPGGDESSLLSLTSPLITVPASGAAHLAFDHFIASEAGFDGGNVKISVNGGAFALVNGADYSFNPYNATVAATNPMAGQLAFTGTDGGSVTGSWGRSVVNLAPYANAGDAVRLRFDFGQDGCTGFQGWYLDDVRLYSCAGAGSPSLAIADASVLEGNAGNTNTVLTVTLSSASGTPVTVDYATQDGTATLGNNDYLTTSGTLTFAPGELSKGVTVSVVGDTAFEPNEFFNVNLSNATGATILDGLGVGTIVNDDAVNSSAARSELAHGSRVNGALVPVGTAADTEYYVMRQAANSSYEVVMDATSGDIGGASGAALDRLAADGTTVLTSSQAIGVGSSRSLRWMTTSTTDGFVRVQSNTCTTDCGPDDVFRLRAYETTYSIPRFNNASSQVTVLVLQNPTNYTISGSIDFWSTSGAALASQPFTLVAKSGLVLNTTSVPGLLGASGSVTIAHDGRFGDLTGKTVALEPSTGFSFDSQMILRAQ